MGSGVGVVVRQLRARLGEIESAIFTGVRDVAFGPVGAQDAEYVAGLRAAVVASVDYVLEEIERGEGRVGPIPGAACEQARRAARVGVGLETVLRRYVVGHTLLEAFVVEEVDRGEFPPGERRVLQGVLRAQASVLNRLLAAVTVEYGNELRRAGRSPERRRVELVCGLLDGGALERPELDYDLDGWHLGMIATGTGVARAVRELAAGVDRRLLSVEQGERSVWAWLGGSERLAFADVERVLAGMDGIEAHPPVGVMLALGEPAREIEGWRLTHRQAQAALLVALRRRTRPGVLTRYGDVALLANALNDEALARALIDIYIAPLEDSRGRRSGVARDVARLPRHGAQRLLRGGRAGGGPQDRRRAVAHDRRAARSHAAPLPGRARGRAGTGRARRGAACTRRSAATAGAARDFTCWVKFSRSRPSG